MTAEVPTKAPIVARLNVELSSELAGAKAIDKDVIKVPIFLSMGDPKVDV